MKILKDTGKGCSITVYLVDHELESNEILCPAELPAKADYLKIVNGELVVDEALLLSSREAELKPEALTYQSKQQSPNELALIHGYSKADLDVMPKAKEQKEWMDSIFALYGARLVDVTNDTPFESVGEKPHSFDDLYTEKYS